MGYGVLGQSRFDGGGGAEMRCVICGKEAERKICPACDAQIERETEEREVLLAARVKR